MTSLLLQLSTGHVDSSENCRVNERNSGVGERDAFFFAEFTVFTFMLMCSFNISSIISLYSISSVCESLAVRSNSFRLVLVIGAPNISDGSPVGRYSGCVHCRTNRRVGSFLFTGTVSLFWPSLSLNSILISFRVGCMVFALSRNFRLLPRLDADSGRALDARLEGTGLISTSVS